MRRKIRDHDSAAIAKHSRGFPDCCLRIIKKVQDLMEHHGVEALFGSGGREGQPVHIAAAHLAIGGSGIRQPVSRNGQHLRTAVDSNAALDKWRQQFQNASSACPRIQNLFQPPALQQPDNRAFHLCLGNMQRANFFPLRRIGGKISGGLSGAFLADLRQPLEVFAQQRFLRRIAYLREYARQCVRVAMFGSAIKYPGPFLYPLKEPGIA